jgi:hypothetical protein
MVSLTTIGPLDSSNPLVESATRVSHTFSPVRASSASSRASVVAWMTWLPCSAMLRILALGSGPE